MEELAFVKALLAELETLKAENAHLIEENERLRAGEAEPEPVGPEPLKEYGSFDEIVWESNALNADSNFRLGTIGKAFSGHKHVLVNGQRYRRKSPSAGPEWYHIAHYGVIDVTANPWIAPAYEEGVVEYKFDKPTMIQRIRDYAGGLKYGIGAWPEWAQQAFLETHKKPDGRNPGRVTFVTPAG